MNEIKTFSLTKTYGKVTALNNINTTFKFGKIYGLLGRNGAGKSTLLKILTNRAFADTGEILIDDEVVTENSNLKNLVAFMTEEHYYSSYKVSQILKATKSFQPKFDLDRAMRYSQTFGLNTKKKFSALSTGYKNIFKLIITLCHDLPYLVFDEPVVGLDAYHRELFYKLLLECYNGGERTIILATHLIEEVQNIVEDVAIIDKGELLFSGNVDELVSRGFSVAGKPSEVDEFTNGLNVIDEEHVSGMKVVYVLEDSLPKEAPPTIITSKLSLQKIFVKLTGGKENE